MAGDEELTAFIAKRYQHAPRARIESTLATLLRPPV